MRTIEELTTDEIWRELARARRVDKMLAAFLALPAPGEEPEPEPEDDDE